MTSSFTATFKNNPSYADVLEFALSHGITCWPTEIDHTYELVSDNLDFLEEAHDQLKSIAGPIVTV